LYSNCGDLNTEHCEDCVSGQVECESPKEPSCNVVGQCEGKVDLVTNTADDNEQGYTSLHKSTQV
jgi:hypothetical protein